MSKRLSFCEKAGLGREEQERQNGWRLRTLEQIFTLWREEGQILQRGHERALLVAYSVSEKVIRCLIEK